MQHTVIDEPARLRAAGDPPIETWTDFLRLCAEMVSDHAPYLFAVVQERGEREDGWIAGWGLAFPDHVDVVTVDGRTWTRLATPAEAERMFDGPGDVSGLLVWCDTEALA
jgi:hypothetical protein